MHFIPYMLFISFSLFLFITHNKMCIFLFFSFFFSFSVVTNAFLCRQILVQSQNSKSYNGGMCPRVVKFHSPARIGE